MRRMEPARRAFLACLRDSRGANLQEWAAACAGEAHRLLQARLARQQGARCVGEEWVEQMMQQPDILSIVLHRNGDKLDRVAALVRNGGDLESSIHMHRWLLSLREAHQGWDHNATLRSARELACCLIDTGRQEEAMQLLGRTLGLQPGALRGPLLDLTRAAVQARRQASQQGRAEPGTAAFVAEWDPTPAPPGSAAGRGVGGGGRGRGRGREQHAAGRGGHAAAEPEDEEGTAPSAGAAGPGPLLDVCEGLAPLPAGLVARPWAELRGSHLGGDECAICLEELGSVPGLLVQLRCRHLFCELCVRQQLHSGHAAAATCPQCRGGIV